MSKKKLILIADDERGIHESLRMYITREGYEVYSVFKGDDVMEAFTRMQPDLIILDIMMPGRQGRGGGQASGLRPGGGRLHRQALLPAGVVSRIQVIFRRLNQMSSDSAMGKLTVGNTRIDLKCYEVFVDDRQVLLSPKEVEILHLMAGHPRQVFTREQLLDNIWGFDFNGDPRVVDTSIKRIRKKLPENTDILLKSVYGVGYKVEVRENA